jgi:hypothetical protein
VFFFVVGHGNWQVGSTERDFEGFEGTVSVERVVSEVPARARALRPERQQCGDYWKRNIWRSEVNCVVSFFLQLCS